MRKEPFSLQLCGTFLKIGWFIPSSSVRKKKKIIIKPSLQQRSAPPPPPTCMEARAHTHTRFLTPPTENRSAAHRHNSKQMHGLAHVARAQLLFVRVVTHTLTCTHIIKGDWWAPLISQVDFSLNSKRKERTKQHVGKRHFFFIIFIFLYNRLILNRHPPKPDHPKQLDSHTECNTGLF